MTNILALHQRFDRLALAPTILILLAFPLGLVAAQEQPGRANGKSQAPSAPSISQGMDDDAIDAKADDELDEELETAPQRITSSALRLPPRFRIFTDKINPKLPRCVVAVGCGNQTKPVAM
jgi:hypothetical protein